MSTPISEAEKARIKLQGFLEDKLKWHDYTHIAVTDDSLDPASRFVHTVGRARKGQPELIVTGVHDERLAMDLIADVAAYEQRTAGLQDGAVIPPEEARITLLLKDVSTDFVRNKRVAQATSRYGSNIRIVQIAWPDAQGRFPATPGYDQQHDPQEALWAV